VLDVEESSQPGTAPMWANASEKSKGKRKKKKKEEEEEERRRKKKKEEERKKWDVADLSIPPNFFCCFSTHFFSPSLFK